MTDSVGPRPFADASSLLEGVIGGDPTAWSEIVRRYEGLLRFICRNHRLSREQTADVLQWTWVRLFMHADQVRDPEAIVGWLITTTARECLTVLRRETRELPVEDLQLEEARTTDGQGTLEVEDKIDAVGRERLLRSAVTRLSPREQALIALLLEPELPSYSEISRRLSMPLGSIGPIRQRALVRLRRLLEEHEELAVPA